MRPPIAMFVCRGINGDIYGYRTRKDELFSGFSSQEECIKHYEENFKEEEAEDFVADMPPGAQVCIDFDRTIYPDGEICNLEDMCEPDPVCVKTIKELYDAGYNITIFSCRGNISLQRDNIMYTQLVSTMYAYLNKYEIPFHDIFMGKPNYYVVIDDKAIGFKGSWQNVRKELGMKD